jgi:hypothetical protein
MIRMASGFWTQNNKEVIDENGNWLGNPIDMSLSDLNNVSSDAPATGQVLKWDGAQWSPGIDLVGGGTGGATTLAELNDVSSTAPSNGQVLKWNGSLWAPAVDATGLTSLSGSAISDLQNVSATVPTEGQVLKWSGTEWAPEDDLGFTGSLYADDFATLQEAIDAAVAQNKPLYLNPDAIYEVTSQLTATVSDSAQNGPSGLRIFGQGAAIASNNITDYIMQINISNPGYYPLIIKDLRIYNPTGNGIKFNGVSSTRASGPQNYGVVQNITCSHGAVDSYLLAFVNVRHINVRDCCGKSTGSSGGGLLISATNGKFAGDINVYGSEFTATNPAKYPLRIEALDDGCEARGIHFTDSYIYNDHTSIYSSGVGSLIADIYFNKVQWDIFNELGIPCVDVQTANNGDIDNMLWEGCYFQNGVDAIIKIASTDATQVIQHIAIKNCQIGGVSTTTDNLIWCYGVRDIQIIGNQFQNMQINNAARAMFAFNYPSAFSPDYGFLTLSNNYWYNDDSHPLGAGISLEITEGNAATITGNLFPGLKDWNLVNLGNRVTLAANFFYGEAAPDDSTTLITDIHVKDYGAVGDGVTDDRAAFYAAFAAAAAKDGDGVVYVSDGQYLIESGNLEVPPGVHVKGPYLSPGDRAQVGEGTYPRYELMDCIMMNPTYSIKMRENSSLSGLVIFPTSATAAVEWPAGWRFPMDYTEGVTDADGLQTGGWQGRGIYAQYADDITIRDCLILGFYEGISFNNCQRTKLQDLNMDCARCIRLETVRDISRINNVHCWPFATRGAYVNNPYDPNRDGSDEPRGVGIHLTNIGDWVKVTDCFTFGYRRGFLIEDVDNVILMGCGADNWVTPARVAGTVGFDIQGSSKETKLIGCQSAAHVHAGLRIATDSTSLTQVSSFSAWGVVEHGIIVNSGRILISDSTFREVGNGITALTGTDGIIHNTVRIGGGQVTNLPAGTPITVTNSKLF